MAPLIILSGPSGVGKTTTTDHLLARLSLLTRVITTTTRRPRAGERHGIHYFFVSHEAFAQLAAAHAFLEVNNFGGQSYGTPRSMLTFLSKGMPRIVLPDVHGARALKAYVPDAVCIWLEAPLPILTQRLSARSSEPLEKQQERITIAHAEIAQAHSSNLYTHVIDMTNFEQAEDEIEGIIKKLLKI